MNNSANLLLLDKSRTLVRPLSGGTFSLDPCDQELLPGVKEAISYYHNLGWRIEVVSNQGGIAANHKTLGFAFDEMKHLMQLLPQIKGCYFCPDFEGESCYYVWEGGSMKYDSESHSTREAQVQKQFRKPNPGMLKLALHKYTPANAWCIGNHADDERAAIAAGIPFMWADTWLGRFAPGIYELREATLEQVRFLESINAI